MAGRVGSVKVKSQKLKGNSSAVDEAALAFSCAAFELKLAEGGFVGVGDGGEDFQDGAEGRFLDAVAGGGAASCLQPCDVAGEVVGEVVRFFDDGDGVQYFGDGCEGLGDGAGVDAGAFDFHELLAAAEDGAEARRGAAAGTGVGVEGGDVTGAEAEEGEAFGAQRGDGDVARLAGGSGWWWSSRISTMAIWGLRWPPAHWGPWAKVAQVSVEA